MLAAQRLFLTADRSRLVREGHSEAAFLYAAPGDEIPASAAEKFGLVDGRIVAGLGTILRVATVTGLEMSTDAGFVFHSGWTYFRVGDLNESHLLNILKSAELRVDAALVDDKGWVPFPGREQAVAALQAHIDYDLAHGRPHDPVGGQHQNHPADSLDQFARNIAASAGGAAKEGDAGDNKEAAPVPNKEAPAAPDKVARPKRSPRKVPARAKG